MSFPLPVRRTIYTYVCVCVNKFKSRPGPRTARRLYIPPFLALIDHLLGSCGQMVAYKSQELGSSNEIIGASKTRRRETESQSGRLLLRWLASVAGLSCQ